MTVVNPLTSNKQTKRSNSIRPKHPSALSASFTLAWRASLRLRHNPASLWDIVMLPIIFTLMFTFLFGGAVSGSTDVYIQQLIPGMFVFAVAMLSQYTAIALSNDISKGVFDRFRTLAIWRPAILIGALLNDMLRYVIATSIIFALGLILGFRPETGIGNIFLSMLLLLVFAFSFSWIWTAIGLIVNNPENVATMSSLASFLLSFLSNVFVDPATMPELLRIFVSINPISLTATAMRGLLQGNIVIADLAPALFVCAIMILVFAPMSMYFFNRKNT